ncbi:ribonuclease H-like domain-containing protein [Tanacetum coccineum]
MTGATPLPTQPKQPIDKAYSIASIKACIPTPIDLDKINYNAWSTLFKRFCCTYEVQHHLDAPATTETSNSTIDPLHESNDSLVVMWMYSTISPKLVEMVVDDDTSAHGVWKRLKDLFHNNKDARVTQLDNEIRNMAIDSLSVTDFFQEIKSKADRLANLDSPVKDTSLVTYAVNGIRSNSTLLHNTPSSPTVLVASTTPTDKANTMSTSGFDVCRNFQRGSCSYGARSSSTVLLQRIITPLHGEFAMTDLGSLNYFLGISLQRLKFGLFLSQSKFAAEILERAHMQHCNPCKTLVDTESKLGSDGDPISDPTLYRSLAGALQYLTFTRPNISYAVQHICLYMHDPRDPHFNALKRILRYVRGTLDHGLQLQVSSASQLTAFTDADWAGCPVTCRSTSG